METSTLIHAQEAQSAFAMSNLEAADIPADFLSKFLDPAKRHQQLIIKTNELTGLQDICNIYRQMGYPYDTLVNLWRINDIRYINKFFEEVNHRLPENGLFIGCVETKAMRKARILANYPPVINWIYYTLDFVFRRIFPKVPVLKKIYFGLTRGRTRVLTSVETLGRLYSCGFKVVDLHQQPKKLFFIAQKIKLPEYNMMPSYGPLFKMKRSGLNGRPIHVYKLRTMHPYAEYLQEYIYEKNKLCEGGKFHNDIRVTTLGKFCRKFWLDELPMVLNVLLGDLKLVGVRPLSAHYLSLYSQELRDMRCQCKPGLIPPFYADMPKTLDEIMASELRYLKAYQKNPWKTDMRYLFKIFKNIVLKKARSQ